MSAHAPKDPAERARVLAALAIIQILFGIHYLAGKIVLHEIPPRAWAVLRVASSAIVLVVLARAMGRRFPRTANAASLASPATSCPCIGRKGRSSSPTRCGVKSRSRSAARRSTGP